MSRRALGALRGGSGQGASAGYSVRRIWPIFCDDPVGLHCHAVPRTRQADRAWICVRPMAIASIPRQIERLGDPDVSGAAIPLGAARPRHYGLEYGVIWERDRQPPITVQADTRNGVQGLDVTNAIDKKHGALHEPPAGRLRSRSAARWRKTERPGFDQRADAAAGDRGADTADAAAAEFQPHADGGADGAAGPDRRDPLLLCSASRSASSPCSARSRCSASSCATR